MKNLTVFFYVLFLSQNFFGQGGTSDPFKGPMNISSLGVLDGVVLNEELPLRSKIEYEHVRFSDYVWSKRVFSRIDSREKINHTIFYPYDYFKEDFELPSKKADIDNQKWVKHQDRYSLWTIIVRHIMLGDIRVYNVANPDFSTIEDGYQLKYPILSSVPDPFFNDPAYKRKIGRIISHGGPGPKWEYEDDINQKDYYTVTDSSQSFDDWFSYFSSQPNMSVISREPKELLKIAYEEAVKNGKQYLAKSDLVAFISSKSISAYNIKEDWFFDKERSVLDKRIIAIAPVGRYLIEEGNEEGEAWEVSVDGIDRFKNFVAINEKGAQVYLDDKGVFNLYDGAVIEREMFWLYFPELRNVIVNYFVYNEKSDAQWMSFDDLFWKHRFSGMVYKSTDKFDRQLEDYRYGVDALYEAEKIKDDIRKWEHDVWNY